MVDSRIENLAKLCVQYSVDVKPKEKVFIQGNVVALPLIRELYKKCLLAGAHPTIMPSLDLEYIFFKYAKEHQLKFVSPFEKSVSSPNMWILLTRFKNSQIFS
ncbi:unnamed protein product [marine sediment metagenome]|uniref:AMP-dependent synthetase/ligase domain-containing protein n=1 Tax=marine sediment metagenome TaxID=412755 RepID=X0YM47_9ZZZZ